MHVLLQETVDEAEAFRTKLNTIAQWLVAAAMMADESTVADRQPLIERPIRNIEESRAHTEPGGAFLLLLTMPGILVSSDPKT